MTYRRKDDRSRPLYMISVVSEMLGVHQQTLRMYEREGFVCPHRTSRQRLYSDEDVRRLDLVIQLTKDLGVNRAGVDIILRMRSKIEVLHKEMADMMGFLDDDVRREFEKRLKRIFSEER